MSQSPRRLARLWMRDRLADPVYGWNAVNPGIAQDFGVTAIQFDFLDWQSANVRASYLGDFRGAQSSSMTDTAMLTLHTGDSVNARRIKFSPFAGIVEGVARFFIDREAAGMEEQTESDLEAIEATMLAVFNRLNAAQQDGIEYNLGILSRVEPVTQEGDGYKINIEFALEIGVTL